MPETKPHTGRRASAGGYALIKSGAVISVVAIDIIMTIEYNIICQLP